MRNEKWQCRRGRFTEALVLEGTVPIDTVSRREADFRNLNGTAIPGENVPGLGHITPGTICPIIRNENEGEKSVKCEVAVSLRGFNTNGGFAAFRSHHS